MLLATLKGVANDASPQIVQVVFDSTNPRASAEFWRQLLGLVYRRGHEAPELGDDDPAGQDWLNLLKPDGTPALAFQKVEVLAHSTWPEPGVPQQLHVDLAVGSVAELDTIHERVLELGGDISFDRSDDVDEPLRVFRDPDGHPFCIFVRANAH